jgi:hypothetical protein
LANVALGVLSIKGGWRARRPWEQYMAEPEVEAAWRAEFGRIRETEAHHGGHPVPDSAKADIRWSGDEVEVRRLREEHDHHYLRWGFLSTVAVMIVGLIGVGLTFLD